MLVSVDDGELLLDELLSGVDEDESLLFELSFELSLLESDVLEESEELDDPFPSPLIYSVPLSIIPNAPSILANIPTVVIPALPIFSISALIAKCIRNRLNKIVIKFKVKKKIDVKFNILKILIGKFSVVIILFFIFYFQS